MRTMFLLGRALFGGFFIQNGLNHFKNQKMMSDYAASKGVPQPQAAVAASGALFLAGGLSIITGAAPRQGLAALAAVLVPITLQMHRFWDVSDPSQQMNEKINFTKNAAIIGAALMLTQVPTPWPASVSRLRSDDEMYIHLGNRDYRRLTA
jgi:putative oxidoreductase